MTQQIALLVITITALTASPSAPAPGEISVALEESERILELIFSRSVDIYRTYSGVESVRAETIREYDPETGVLRSVSEVTLKRKDYFYRDPEIEVVTYIKDGKEMKPSAHRVFKGKPAYPVFDKKGREHYDIRVAAIQMINGKKAYRIEVTPKMETQRHFRGNIYCMTKTLKTLLIEGTLAKLEFPLRSFQMNLAMTAVDGVPVAGGGTVRIRVSVPLFYPDTMIVSEFTSSGVRLIKVE